MFVDATVVTVAPVTFIVVDSVDAGALHVLLLRLMFLFLLLLRMIWLL